MNSLAALQLPAAVEAWTGHDTQLLVVAGLGIALIVVLIAKFKLHPFLALVLGSAFVGLASGVELPKIISNFEDGVGGVLKEVGLLIALGAMLGKLLADSGGANRVVDTLLAKAGGNRVVWSITLVAVIIGLPMFFEIGLVLLLPVIVLVTQRSKMPLMRIAIPALAGLSVLHGLVPPHPGPLIAISAVKAELGTTLALGLLVAIPTVIICGPLFSRLAAKWVPVGAPAVAGGIDEAVVVVLDQRFKDDVCAGQGDGGDGSHRTILGAWTAAGQLVQSKNPLPVLRPSSPRATLSRRICGGANRSPSVEARYSAMPSRTSSPTMSVVRKGPVGCL